MTEMVAPARSDEQRLDALVRANSVLCYRAALKRDLKAGTGRRTVLDIIAAPTELEETWKVYDVLMQMPHVGRTKANRILSRQYVSPSKTVAGLSPRQRAVLLAVLRGSSAGLVAQVLPGHDITIEQRKKPCCDHHYANIAVCSCGWESRHYDDVSEAIQGHRLTVVEDAIVASRRPPGAVGPSGA